MSGQTEYQAGVEQDFVTSVEGLELAGTPLRRFTGKFVGSGEDPADMRIFPTIDSQNNRMTVALNFTDLTNVESVAPYPHPTAQLVVSYSRGGKKPSERGAWGLLLKSAEKLNFPDLKKLLGKTLVMVCDAKHEYGTDDKGAPITGMVWTIESVGAGKAQATAAASSPTDVSAVALELIHGKDRGEFSRLALQDSRMKSSGSAILNGSLVSELLVKGLVVTEGDTFWVVGRDRTATG